MKRIVVDFTDRSIRRAVARMVLESLKEGISQFSFALGVAVLLLVLAAITGIISSTTALALVVGVFIGLLAVAMILLNSYWQNSKHAIAVYRKGHSKSVEIELSAEGCQVRFGDWFAILSWLRFSGTTRHGDLTMLRFSAEKKKLSPEETRVLAKNLSLREGGQESFGFPILCLFPLSRYQFVAIPAGAGLSDTDLKTYLPSKLI